VVDELSGIFPEAPKLFGFQVERFDDADARQQFHQHRVLQHVGPAPEAAGLARLFAEDEQWKETERQNDERKERQPLPRFCGSLRGHRQPFTLLGAFLQCDD